MTAKNLFTFPILYYIMYAMKLYPEESSSGTTYRDSRETEMREIDDKYPERGKTS